MVSLDWKIVSEKFDFIEDAEEVNFMQADFETPKTIEAEVNFYVSHPKTVRHEDSQSTKSKDKTPFKSLPAVNESVIIEVKAESINQIKSKKERKKRPLALMCDLCGFSSKFKGNMNQHMLIHDEKNRLCCIKCEYSTFYGHRLKNHLKVVHDGIPFSCNQCSYSTTSEKKIRYHKKSVHQGVSYYCEFCTFKTIYPTSFDSHQRAFHSSDEEKLVCSEHDCDYKTTLKHRLQIHRDSFHNVRPKPSCDQCGNFYANLNRLKMHIKSLHSESKFNCDECDYSSNFKRSLVNHVRVKHKGSLFTCSECSYQAAHLQNVKEHKNQVHLKYVLHCKVKGCNFQSFRSEALRRHNSSVHEEITYNCEKCDYKAKRKDHLRQHTNSKACKNKNAIAAS